MIDQWVETPPGVATPRESRPPPTPPKNLGWERDGGVLPRLPPPFPPPPPLLSPSFLSISIPYYTTSSHRLSYKHQLLQQAHQGVLPHGLQVARDDLGRHPERAQPAPAVKRRSNTGQTVVNSSIGRQLVLKRSDGRDPERVRPAPAVKRWSKMIKRWSSYGLFDHYLTLVKQWSNNGQMVVK